MNIFTLSKRLCAIWFALQVSPILAQQPPLQTIADARKQVLGAVVRVAGRVTSAAELGTTSYLQDGTGGIAVFNASFTSGTMAGDSVEISGPLSEFQATTGVLGSGLLQISGTSATVSWRVVPVARISPQARVISLRDISENLESQLVRLNNVEFRETGVFRGNTNFTITDGSTTAQVRISNGTNLVNAAIPTGKQVLTGLLGQFRGTYQITPRFTSDIGIQTTVNPFDTIPKSRTLDVTTWNVKWFGRPRDNDGVTVLGPTDSLLQLRNVTRVLDSIDADIYGIQEVSNSALFRRIQDSLPRYGVVIADGIQPLQPEFVAQRTAFVYKKSEMDTLRTALLLTNTQFAARRFPFLMDVRLRPSGRVVCFVVIHAKSGSTARDYELRTTDAQALYEVLRPLANLGAVVLLGDFNDGLTSSIVNNQTTPYAPFLNDSTRFFSPTLALGRQGLSSFATGASVIDNIIVSRFATRSALIPGAEKIENTSFIPSYVTTTSDHYPVTVRMYGERIQNVIDNVREDRAALAGSIFPNPASQLVHVAFSLDNAAFVRCVVVNALGQEVLRTPELVMGSGLQQALLDVSGLQNGVYFCRILAGNYTQTLPLTVFR
jgi:endonuclease/exonuclease/phosphatase family metal-dependent hydrolase